MKTLLKIKDKFVPIELVLILKELGFNEDCLGTWELMPTGSESSDIVLNLMMKPERLV